MGCWAWLKTQPSGLAFFVSKAQHPMIKIYNTSRREGSDSTRNVVRHEKLFGHLMQERWFVALKIICTESLITINIHGIVFFRSINRSIIKRNHIDIGTKAAVGMRSLLWRTRLLDAGSCSFTHSTVKDIPYISSPKSAQPCYNRMQQLSWLEYIWHT